MDFKTTAVDLKQMATMLVSAYPLKANAKNWGQKPLLVTARSDDRLKILLKIAFHEHLFPWDLRPSIKTAIVFFIPFIRELIEQNSGGKFPGRNRGLAYESTNKLIGVLSEAIKNCLEEEGALSALTPATHNFNPVKLVAGWSHKHLAYISGLGLFSINAQLITPAGCAGRLGSLVTEVDLGNNFMVEHRELFLHKASQNCLKCIGRCPVGATGEDGIDRHRCFARLKVNINHTKDLAGPEETTHVCGKCVVNLPCSIDPLGQQT